MPPSATKRVTKRQAAPGNAAAPPPSIAATGDAFPSPIDNSMAPAGPAALGISEALQLGEPTILDGSSPLGDPSSRGDLPELTDFTEFDDDACAMNGTTVAAAPPVVGVTGMSPIALSLFNAVKSPLTACKAVRDDALASHPNPRTSGKMPDSAKYWHTSSGNVLVLRIPCLVDAGVPGVRTGKKLDLYGDEVTDEKFKKLRAAFGFRCLPAGNEVHSADESYPPEVLKAASEAQRLLYMLQSKCEAVREQSDSIRVTGFFRADTVTDSFQYLVRTEPIFTPVPDPTSCSTIPLIDLTGDSESELSDSVGAAVFSSPSKLRAQVASKSTQSSRNQPTATAQMANGFTLRDWAPASDPTSPYYQFVGNRKHLWGSRFNIPEIRDRNGVLVQPTEWDAKLSHLTPVTVDVVLKLWEIRASQSRIYQLILRKIQIHPSNSFSLNIAQPDFSSSLKGKRRADVNIDDGDTDVTPPSPTKKSKAHSGFASDKDFVMM